MDPNEVLGAIRELVQEIYEFADDPEVLASSMADAFTELDDWLIGGGELPEEWAPE